MCFINQLEGGSEWLVIRDDIDFNSWSGRVIRDAGEDRYSNKLNCMLASTDRLLKNSYMDAGEASHCEHCANKMYLDITNIYLGVRLLELLLELENVLDCYVDNVMAGERLSSQISRISNAKILFVESRKVWKITEV
ncbi:hypothetical protein AB1I68_00600 [Paenibacillus pabuli]